MAWWNTQLLFQDDQLIAEGINPLAQDGYDTVVLSDSDERPQGADNESAHDGTARSMSSYTRVIVSGYALYGELRGYYALGVAHWQVDPETHRIFMTERSQDNLEPVASLTPAQRQILRECLVRLSPEAWDTSTGPFRQQLEC